jgi:hypothetical protein
MENLDSQPLFLKVYRSLVDMMELILVTNPKTLYETERLTRSSQRAVDNIEWIALTLIPDRPLNLNKSILIDAIMLPNKSISMTWSPDSGFKNSSSEDIKQRINFPETFLDTILGDSHRSDHRIQIILYNINRFFQDPDRVDDVTTIASPVVLTIIVDQKMNITKLVDPVIMQFPQFLWNDSYFPQCVYWEHSLNGGYGGWSGSGCQLIETTDDFIACSCNHLTSFSVLMTLCTNETSCPCEEQDEVALSYISFIGCIISAAALLVTISVLIIDIYQKKRSGKYKPAFLQLNMCLALLLALIFFILATQTTDTDNDWCTISAALLQYFLSSAVLLMLTEAISMYRDIVLAFQSGRPTNASWVFMKIALILAWGVPGVLVLILIILDFTIKTPVYGLVELYRNDRSPGISDGM